MTGVKSTGSLMCENVVRVFVDNPLAGVINIMLILALFLGIIALIGLIFKKKDECIGDGVGRLVKYIGIILLTPFAFGVYMEYYYFSIPITLVILGIGCYFGYLDWKGLGTAADNGHSAPDEEKKDEKSSEETEENAEAVPALSKN